MIERVPAELTDQIERVYQETSDPACAQFEISPEVDDLYTEAFDRVFSVEQGWGDFGEAWFVHPGIPSGKIFRDETRPYHQDYPEPNADILHPGEAILVRKAKPTKFSGTKLVEEIIENRNGHKKIRKYTVRTVRKLESRGVVLRGALLRYGA